MPGLIDATRLFSHQDRAYVSLGAALGLVCLSLMSKLPDLIPAAIKNMKGADFGKAIGEGLGQVTAPLQKAGQTAVGAAKTYVGSEIGKGAGARGILQPVGRAAENIGGTEFAENLGQKIAK